MSYIILLFYFRLGSTDRAVHRPGLPGGLHGVPQGQWHRGPGHDQGNGLPRGAQPAGDLRRGTVPVLQ